ncbi:MAG: carboxypeptidase-like regulatory domain-containing protein, partial [Bacteroidota bacterium]
ESRIATARTILTPWNFLNFDVEYGLGRQNGSDEHASAFRLSGNTSWLSYDARLIRADTKFPGYYRDVDFRSLALNIIPLRNFRIEAYAREEERNRQRDTTQFYAPKDRYYQVGLGYANYFSVSFRTNRQKDQLPGPKFDRRENVIQGRVGYGFDRLSFSLNADQGQTEDLLIGKSSPFRRYAVSSSFRPASSHSYSVSGEYATDRNLFTDETQKRLSGSLIAWILLGQSTQLQMNLYGSRIFAAFTQQYGQVEFSLEHRFPFDHTVVLRGRWTHFSPSVAPRQYSALLEYAVPLAIPVKRTTASGEIRGRVVDESGKGMPGVLVSLGTSAAVTDASGRYSFVSLRPGDYYVLLDKATIGLDRVAMVPMPLKVSVRGGEDVPLDLRVVRSALVEGSIRLVRADTTSSDDSPEAMEGKGGMVLELARDGEVHRRVTDNLGRFSFRDLRPGRWLLRVVG